MIGESRLAGWNLVEAASQLVGADLPTKLRPAVGEAVTFAISVEIGLEEIGDGSDYSGSKQPPASALPFAWEARNVPEAPDERYRNGVVGAARLGVSAGGCAPVSDGSHGRDRQVDQVG